MAAPHSGRQPVSPPPRGAGRDGELRRELKDTGGGLADKTPGSCAEGEPGVGVTVRRLRQHRRWEGGG